MNKLHLRETKKRNLVCMSLHVSQGHGNFPTYFINLTMSVREEVPDSSLGLCSAACLQNHQNRHERLSFRVGLWVLQLWWERYPDLSGSQALPETVKGQLWRERCPDLVGGWAMPEVGGEWETGSLQDIEILLLSKSDITAELWSTPPKGRFLAEISLSSLLCQRCYFFSFTLLKGKPQQKCNNPTPVLPTTDTFSAYSP